MPNLSRLVKRLKAPQPSQDTREDAHHEQSVFYTTNQNPGNIAADKQVKPERASWGEGNDTDFERY